MVSAALRLVSLLCGHWLPSPLHLRPILPAMLPYLHSRGYSR